MKVIRWIIAIIIVIWGLMMLIVSNPVSCLLHLLLAFLISPLSTKLFQRRNIHIKRSVKVLSLLGVFLASAITAFTLTKAESTTTNNENEIIESNDTNNENEIELTRSVQVNEESENDFQDSEELILIKQDEDRDEEVETNENQVLKVHFIDVGQGDCTLIESSGHYMLIDAGPDDYGTRIQKYLVDNNVSKLDCLFLSHPDIDHVGSADVIITKFDIDNIYMSAYEKDNDVYKDLMEAIDYRGYGWETPKTGFQFEIGDARAVVLKCKEYGDANNSSLVVKVSLGDVSFLFTGDSGELSEYDMVSYGADIESTVYQVGHHGSYSSTSQEFLNKVNPQYAVISCGKDNVYGHPHQETLDKLKARNIEVFRTDVQGNIVASTDGESISWNVAPSADYIGGDSDLEHSPKTSEFEIKMNSAPNEVQPIVLNDNVGRPEPTSRLVNESADTNIENTTNTQETGISSGVIGAAAGAAVSAIASTGNSDIGEFKNDPVPSGPSYIGNKTNMKLHRASCSGRLPKESNREYFNTLEEAMQAGYYQENQCKNCHPFH